MPLLFCLKICGILFSIHKILSIMNAIKRNRGKEAGIWIFNGIPAI